MRHFRILVAPIVALALLASIAETLVADACDRDGATATMSAPDTDSGSGGSTRPDGHAAHLCHCVHVHAGVAAATERGPINRSSLAIPVGRESMPPSTDRAPPVRPPLSTRV